MSFIYLCAFHWQLRWNLHRCWAEIVDGLNRLWQPLRMLRSLLRSRPKDHFLLVETKLGRTISEVLPFRQI